MGMTACHMEADQNLIERLKTKSEEDLFEAIEELEEDDNALSGFSPRELAPNDIYPAIWHESEKESLREELAAAFHELKAFFSAMASDSKGIVISIY